MAQQPFLCGPLVVLSHGPFVAQWSRSYLEFAAFSKMYFEYKKKTFYFFKINIVRISF